MKFDEAHILACLRGEAPEDTISEMESLMGSSPEFLRKVKQVSTIYLLSINLDKQKKIDAPQAWNKLSKKISRNQSKQKVWNIGRTAAAILLPLFLLYQYAAVPLWKRGAPEMVTIVSASGIVSKTILPDGSEVWLNSQSTLSYPRYFSGKGRTVYLSGEACFKVVSDKRNRFNVVTKDNITVSAYGTEFDVNTYNEGKECDITLVKGKVAISYDGSSKKEILPEGYKAVLNTQKGELAMLQVDPYAETAWKSGKMVFRRESLENIAKKLSKKFGVDIRLKGDSLRKSEYTATFTTETIDEILFLLQRSSPIKYSVSNYKQMKNGEYQQRVVMIEEKQ